MKLQDANLHVSEVVARICSVRKGVLRNFIKFTGKHMCERVSFLIKLQPSVCNFIKRETLAQVFFCEFCKISKNAFSYITPPVAASEVYEKNSFTYSFSCILLSFSKNALKVCEQNFFHDYKQKVVRDVIFCSITIHFEFGIWRCFCWS